MEHFWSFGFMVFCFGFFLFSIRIVNRDHRESHERRIMEAREFGVDVTRPRPKGLFKHFKD